MRALLEQALQKTDLSFPDWTVLVFTNATPLSAEQVARRHLGGQVVTDAADTEKSIARLIKAGWLVADGDNIMLGHTEKGAALFRTLSDQIKEITQTLYGDLPHADLETTHRTLSEIARRASNLLQA
jgi:DNA-binding MarR family transcriptional regulator